MPASTSICLCLFPILRSDSMCAVTLQCVRVFMQPLKKKIKKLPSASCVTLMGDTVSLHSIKFDFIASSFQQAGCWAWPASCLFSSLLFGFYFEWGLSTKLINIIVQSHLFSRAELPAEIQTGRKDTDGLLRIPGVCLPLEQRACVRARPWPHEGRSLRHHWGSFHPKHPSKGFIYLQLKDEPFNPFL